MMDMGERQPLLLDINGSNSPNNASINGGNEPPPPYSPSVQAMPMIDEGSTPISTNSGVPFINCRVCQTILHVEGKLHLHVIQCYSCGEATPIRPPPDGKKYVRCPCNCLLICKEVSERIVCPRPNCKLVISLRPVTSSDVLYGRNRDSRNIICVHCHSTFSFSDTITVGYSRCPICHGRSSFGTGYRRTRVRLYCVLLFLSIAVALITTLLTIEKMISNSATFYAVVGSFSFLSLVFFLLLVYYCRMRVSRFERSPALQYT